MNNTATLRIDIPKFEAAKRELEEVKKWLEGFQAAGKTGPVIYRIEALLSDLSYGIAECNRELACKR